MNVEFTDEAVVVVDNMRKELHRIASVCGPSSEEYVGAATSLAFSFATMLSLRPERVMADGDLSLFCSNPNFVFGVNYTGTSYNENKIGTWSVNS